MTVMDIVDKKMHWDDLGKDVHRIIITYGFQVEDGFSQWKNHYRGGTNWCRLRRVCREWKEMADALYVFPLQAFFESLKNIPFLRYLSTLPANRIVTEDREISLILFVIDRDMDNEGCEMYKEAYSIFLDLPITINEQWYSHNYRIVEKYLDAEITRKFLSKFRPELHNTGCKFNRWICKDDVELVKVLLDGVPQEHVFNPYFNSKDSLNMSEEVLWILFRSGRVEFKSMFDMAYKSDHVEVVGRLLSSPHEILHDYEINRCWVNGSINMMKLLVGLDERISRKHDEICQVVENDEKQLREFTSKPYASINKMYMLYIASQKGLIKSMKILLEDQSLAFDQMKGDLSPIVDAAFYGQLEAVDLLLRDGRNSDSNTVKALIISVEKQHQEICKLILENKNVDFSEALSFACKAGNEQIVQCLLEHPQTDPSINQSRALREAIVHNHPNIVELLLRDGRSDPCSDCHFSNYTDHENLEIVKILLADDRVDPSACNNRAIRYFKNKDIIECLLKDKRVDPSVEQNEALRSAVELGRADSVDVLLKDPRVHLSDAENAMILLMAAELGHLSTLKLLMEHPKVEMKDHLVELIREVAFNNGHFEIIRLVSDVYSERNSKKKDEEVAESTSKDCWKMAHAFCGIV